jgi:hypothetical protein
MSVTPRPEDLKPPEADAKKPYVKPAVRSERVFETMALSCGKVSTSQASCTHNRKASSTGHDGKPSPSATIVDISFMRVG